MRLRPLQDKVVVRRIEDAETVQNGIVIPDVAKERPMEGEVVAVGSGRREHGELIPVDVQIGNHILFGKYSGTEVNVENQEFVILREEEILTVLEPEKVKKRGK